MEDLVIVRKTVLCRPAQGPLLCSLPWYSWLLPMARKGQRVSISCSMSRVFNVWSLTVVLALGTLPAQRFAQSILPRVVKQSFRVAATEGRRSCWALPHDPELGRD